MWPTIILDQLFLHSKLNSIVLIIRTMLKKQFTMKHKEMIKSQADVWSNFPIHAQDPTTWTTLLNIYRHCVATPTPPFQHIPDSTVYVQAFTFFSPLIINTICPFQWWDCRQNAIHSIRRISGPHICGEGLDIEPETLKVVTGSWRKDNNIQVWDFHSGNLIADVPSDFNRSMVRTCYSDDDYRKSSIKPPPF